MCRVQSDHERASFFLNATQHTKISRECFQRDLPKHFVQKLKSLNSFHWVKQWGEVTVGACCWKLSWFAECLATAQRAPSSEGTVGVRRLGEVPSLGGARLCWPCLGVPGQECGSWSTCLAPAFFQARPSPHPEILSVVARPSSGNISR